MECKREITAENGITIEILVNCTVAKVTEDEKLKLLSRFAKCSRDIYLEIAEEFNKVNRKP